MNIPILNPIMLNKLTMHVVMYKTPLSELGHKCHKLIVTARFLALISISPRLHIIQVRVCDVQSVLTMEASASRQSERFVVGEEEI